jgi:UDP-glucose 4-epimerase
VRVLVTGANGFIGSHLVRQLQLDGHEVLSLVRPNSNVQRLQDIPDLQFLYTDLRNIRTVGVNILAFRAETVYHLAWWGGNSSQYIHDAKQVFENASGSLDLLEITAQAGATRFVGFGTCVEYGRYEIPTSETLEPQPQNLYGISKLRVGQLLECASKALDVSFAWVRPFWLFGQQDDIQRLIPIVIDTFSRGLSPKLTAGEQLWDYLYIADAIKALVSLKDHLNATGVFNLASGSSYPIREIVTFIRDKINLNLETGLGTVDYPQGQIMHLQADVRKLQNAIDWKPETSIWQGLEATIRDYQETRERAS